MSNRRVSPALVFPTKYLDIGQKSTSESLKLSLNSCSVFYCKISSCRRHDMKVYLLRFKIDIGLVESIFFREPDKFSADPHQAWNLHLLHIRQDQSSCRQGCLSYVVGTRICSVYSTT